MAKSEKYREQYCQKHDQHYADFLRECPVCVGEELRHPYFQHLKPSTRPKLVRRPALVKRN